MSSRSEDFIQALNSLKDENTKMAQDIRETRLKFHEKAINDHNKFVTQLGTLSLAVAAAIIPVVIVSSDDIEHPVYLFTALVIYLISGLLSIFWAKHYVENSMATLPNVGLDMELEVEKINHTAQKLLHDPGDDKLVLKIFEQRKDMIKVATKNNQDKPRRVSLLLDIMLGGFIFATLLMSRLLWPFAGFLFWQALTLAVAIYVVYVVIGYYKAKTEGEKIDELRKRLREENDEFLGWQEQNLFGGQK